MSTLRNEGNITFWLTHPHQDWIVNKYGYDFGRLDRFPSDIILSVVKHPDRTLEIIVSGPFNRTHVLKNIIHDSIINDNRLFVVITWRYPKLSLYFNTKNVQTIDVSPIEIGSLDFEVAGAEKIPFSIISEILKNLGTVFNTVSGFQDTDDPAVLNNILKYTLNEHKFSLVESKEGSFTGKIQGVKRVLNFVKKNFNRFFAVIHGYSERVADNYLKDKEIDIALKEETLKHTKLETMEKAIEVAKKLGDAISKNQHNLSETERKELVNDYFVLPMKNIAQTLIENKLTMKIKTEDDN